MELRLDHAVAFVRGGADGLTDLAGIVELDASVSADGHEIEWAIANSAARPIPVRAVGWVVPLDTIGRAPLRMFAHGYQSWSASGMVTLGVDWDPSTADDSFELFCAAHHADQRRAAAGELRSEQVTAVTDGHGAVVIGFLGGEDHDGTFRLREGRDGPELVIEAFLGGALLGGGEARRLHPVRIESCSEVGVGGALDRWAARAGARAAARVSAPYQVGWCSWYHYFGDVTEEALGANLALADDWPFDVFQLDDGYQRQVGDWLSTNAKFPSDLGSIASRIAAAGRRPGIWLAPFLAHPDSDLHRRHPEWIAEMPDGSGPVPGMINDIWGGVVDVVDTTNPEVIAHLENVAAALVDAGFTYLKLDFTYAPSFDGRYHDPSMTPAQRVRAGYDAIRRGAGDDAFILGCGAPLGACVGAVDGMRIGSDVAPSWEVEPAQWHPSAYRETAPSTRNAWQATLARSFLHRRLWLNDPDCLMLRTEATGLSPQAVRAWADAVAASGGMALVSDDLALVGGEGRRLLDEVVAVGRAVDRAAAEGGAPTCDDLMTRRPPTTLRSPVVTLVGDPETAAAGLTRA